MRKKLNMRHGLFNKYIPIQYRKKKNMVVKILEFIFQDIWHFLGTCILLEIIFVKPFIALTSSTIKNKSDK